MGTHLPWVSMLGIGCSYWGVVGFYVGCRGREGMSPIGRGLSILGVVGFALVVAGGE